MQMARLAKWWEKALLASALALLAGGAAAVQAAQASGDVCIALTRDGPTLCPTDRTRKVSIPRTVTLPTLEVEPIDYETWAEEETSSTPEVYAWIDDLTPIYRHPAEAAAGLPPILVSEPGFTYYSLVGLVWYEGEQWYLLNTNSDRNPEHADEYVHEDYVHLVKPSTFAGVHLASQPSIPFAWVLRNVRPSSFPGGPSDVDQPMLQKYARVNIYGSERVGSHDWFLVGANQWVEQTFLGIVDVSERPADIGPDEKWIEVDLYEQTLAAYQGDQMIYATPLSSGLPRWETAPGLYRIWGKVLQDKMSGREGEPDFYFLEDVPWTMYFNWDAGLHGAYWHDKFGYRRSHGCVNLPPFAAQWLYAWTEPYAPEGRKRVYGTGTWVWVH